MNRKVGATRPMNVYKGYGSYRNGMRHMIGKPTHLLSRKRVDIFRTTFRNGCLACTSLFVESCIAWW